MSRTIKKLLQWLEVELGRKVRPVGGLAALEFVASLALLVAAILIPRTAQSLVPEAEEPGAPPVVSPAPVVPAPDRAPAAVPPDDSIYCLGLIRPPLPVPERTPRDCKPRTFEMIPFTDSGRSGTLRPFA